MARKRSKRGVLFLLAFLLTSVVSAGEILDGDLCNIEAERTVSDDVFVLCGDLTIDGHIEGNLIGAARTTRINGQIDGSIYLLGGELIMNGTIGKDVHFGGLILNITEDALFQHRSGSIISINLSGTISPQAAVPGGILDLGYQLIVDGNIGGHISFWGSALHVAGKVNGNITATVGNSQSDGASSQIETLLIPFPFDIELVDPGLFISRTAEVNGQLQYTGPTPGIINAKLGQKPIFNPTEPVLTGTPVEQSARSLQQYLEDVLQEFFNLAFIGVIFLLVTPRQMQAPLRSMRTHPISTLGVGMLSFILSFPIFLIIAFFSILIMVIISLLPLDDVVVFGGVALALANIGSASIFYFTAIYIARIIFGLALGKFVIRLFDKDDGSWRSLFLSLSVGLIALSLANSIPTIGWGIDALALFLGLGAILSVLRIQVKRFLDTSPIRMAGAANGVQPMAPLLPRPPGFREPQRFARPMLNNDPPPPGANNLPEGFDWWGEEDNP